MEALPGDRHCLFYWPNGSLELFLIPRSKVIDHGKAPARELVAVLALPCSSIAERNDRLPEGIEFRPTRLGHAMHPHVPADEVRDQISKLDARRQIAVHEDGLRNDTRAPKAPCPGLSEVATHLVGEQMALRASELVEHDQALVPSWLVLEEIEEALEEIGIVLPEKIATGTRGAARLSTMLAKGVQRNRANSSMTSPTNASFAWARAACSSGPALPPSSRQLRARVRRSFASNAGRASGAEKSSSSGALWP